MPISEDSAATQATHTRNLLCLPASLKRSKKPSGYLYGCLKSARTFLTAWCTGRFPQNEKVLLLNGQSKPKFILSVSRLCCGHHSRIPRSVHLPQIGRASCRERV